MQHRHVGLVAWTAILAAVVAVVLVLLVIPAAPSPAGLEHVFLEHGDAALFASHELGTGTDAAPHASQSAASDALTTAARASATPAPAREPTGSITGLVLGGRTSREPLAGATVRLRLGVVDPAQALALTTGADGRFACTGLREGAWFADVTAPDHQKLTRIQRLWSEGATSELEVSLRMRRTIEVRAVDERGLPIRMRRLGVAQDFQRELHVAGLHESDSPRPVPGHAFVVSRSDGRSVDGIELVGELRQLLHGDALVVLCVGERVAAYAPVPTAGDEVQLVVEAPTIARLTRDLEFLVTADGAPLAGTMVSPELSDGTSVSAVTDAAGRARKTGVPFARYELRVRADGYPPQRSFVDADRVETTHVEMPPPRRIAGRVVRESEVPESSVRVAIWRVDDDEKRLGLHRDAAWTKADADFEFATLEPGTYVISASSSARDASGADVRRGELPGAAWIDVRGADAPSVVIDVAAVADLDTRPYERTQRAGGGARVQKPLPRR